jgi:Electron transfer DM13
VAALAVGVFVAVWFQPQRLFIDERVDQAVPTAAAPEAPAPTEPSTRPATPPADAGATTTAPPPPPEPVDLATGSFVSRDHGTTGTVRVLELVDGRRFVRLENFETDSGPDVYVYLSTNPADGPEGAFDDSFVNLGRMQGNIGDQNYEVPEDVDPGAYASVVIWCDRFDSAFGAADLLAPPP